MRNVLFCALALALAGCGARPGNQSMLNAPHLGVAQAAEDSGDYSMAETILAGAAQAAPNDAALQLRYADVLIKQSKISQARDILAQRVVTVSNPQMLHGALGAIEVMQGEPAQAIVEFDAVTGDEARWTVDKAIALDMLERHDEAQVLYRRALATQPDDAAIINDLALSLMLAGRANEARQIVAPLAARTDLSPRIQADLGVLRAASGDLAGAHQFIGAGVNDEQLLRLADAINKKVN